MSEQRALSSNAEQLFVAGKLREQRRIGGAAMASSSAGVISAASWLCAACFEVTLFRIIVCGAGDQLLLLTYGVKIDC